MYIYLLFIHIASAMTAIVAIVCYPLIMSAARTANQARFALKLLEKAAILPKIGGSLLLLTGIGLGLMETYLFRQLWYIASILIFAILLVIMAALIPARIKEQLALLQQAKGDELPETYRRSRRRSALLEGAANLAVIISLVLMVFKPF